MSKKLISVCIPVFNEKENIENAYDRISAVMREMDKYEYEIVFFDDGSTDGSDLIVEELCERDEHVKAVFYERNFGYSKTVFYCMQQAKGDAAIIVHCDMQNSPEEIPNFIEKWEQGADVVLGVKSKSKENKLMYFIRTLGYWILNLVFGMHIVPHATEYELLDKSIIENLGGISTQNPFLRGYILEYGKNIQKLYYTQDKRRKGKSHFNLTRYYDFAIGGIVSLSDCLPRRFILFSFISAVALLLEFFIHYVPKCFEMKWNEILNGFWIRFGVLAVLLLIMLVSMLFEYVLTIIKNTEQKPIIIEKKRVRY